MAGLTERDGQGNWHVKGLPWERLQEGKPVTNEIWERLYGCLFKLMQYEKTGLTPDQVAEMQEMNFCVPEYTQEIIPFGLKMAKCKCGDIVTDEQNYCDRCGVRLLWRGKEGNNDGPKKGEE